MLTEIIIRNNRVVDSIHDPIPATKLRPANIDFAPRGFAFTDLPLICLSKLLTSSDGTEKVALCISEYFTQKECLLIASTRAKPINALVLLKKLANVKKGQSGELLVLTMVHHGLTELNDSLQGLIELEARSRDLFEEIAALISEWMKPLAFQSSTRKPAVSDEHLKKTRKALQDKIKDISFSPDELPDELPSNKKRKTDHDSKGQSPIVVLNDTLRSLRWEIENANCLVDSLGKTEGVPLQWKKICRIIKDEDLVIVNSEFTKNQSPAVKIIESYFYLEAASADGYEAELVKNMRKNKNPFGTGLVATPGAVELWTGALFSIIRTQAEWPIYTWFLTREAATWEAPRYFTSWPPFRLKEKFEQVYKFANLTEKLSINSEVDFLENLIEAQAKRADLQEDLEELEKKKNKLTEGFLQGVTESDLKILTTLGKQIKSLELQADQATSYVTYY